MNRKRNVYLKMTPLSQARKVILETFSRQVPPDVEMLAPPDAVGRILAKPVTAEYSSPNFHAAAMDGIAVAAKKTFSAHASRPKVLHVGKDAFFVNTGQVLPEQTDAIIMIEHVQQLDDRQVVIEAPAYPWQHVRKMGEDIVATELLFARHHCITPYCVGALLSAGVFEVAVLQHPKVVIIPTGSELLDWHMTPPEQIEPGRIIESNSYMLSAMVEAAGGSCDRSEIIGDDQSAIQSAIRKAVKDDEVDLVMITGGSSAGSEDFSRMAIASEGEVLIHGVTMMPGKPLIAGRVSEKPVFAIPGYPVSAIMAFEQLVSPLLAKWLGQVERRRSQIEVTPTRKIASKLGMEEFVRVKIGCVGEKTVATSLPRGAGQITSMTRADGIIRIPAHMEGLGADSPVKAELFRPMQEIDRTIVIVGSHDNTLDLLADELRSQGVCHSLSSSHVGSIGGLMAIQRGLCHAAGTHLLDENDGSYNISYIHRYLKDVEVGVVHLVMRDQGLMLPRGNPKNIGGLKDILREDVSIINRQSGSGTRILLDYRLKQLGISSEQIAGYQTEVFTHMDVAAAVLSGAADVGLGIYAAAKALELDFLPIVTEQYDLIIPAVYFDSPPIDRLLNVIRSAAFKRHVSTLGGYHTERTGEVLI